MDIKFPIISILLRVAPIVVLVGVIVAAVFIVRWFVKESGKGGRTAKRWRAVIVLCVLVSGVAWILNMGWFRVFLTWVPLPLAHVGFFVWLNFKAAANVSQFGSLKKYIILSCVTYLLPYLTFPDGGDVGGMYFFFGLIRNDIAADIMMYITFAVLILSIVVLILEYIELKKSKA